MHEHTTIQGVGGGLGRGLVLLVIALCGGFLAIILWGAYAAVDTLSAVAIDRAANQTDTELRRFFNPVESNLQTALGWASLGALDPADVEGMNARFIPLLEHMPQVSSMLVATPSGVEYLLLKDGDGWKNRSTDVQTRPGVTLWKRWSDAKHELETFSKEIDYDPRSRPWFQAALAGDPRRLNWTDPYVFFTTKDPGITVSSRVPTPNGEMIVAFDVLLLDISRFTTGLHVSPNGKVFVLTEDSKVLGLPTGSGFDGVEQLRGAVLKPVNELQVAEMTAAMGHWVAADAAAQIDFHSEEQEWFGAFRPYELGARRLWIGVVVPSADFKGTVTKQRWALVVLALFGVLAAAALALVFTRRYRLQLNDAVDEARERLGQYRLEKKIGQGGMGDVYRGSHMLMRRDVAIKIVRADKLSAEFVKRFEREVRLTSRLSHPNTIQIFDYGNAEGERFYYVMELLNGLSLAKYVELAGCSSPARTIHLVRQICESLREAHAAGLVHRDIKPGNVHLCERGGRYDFVKVLDFGLVKDVGASNEQTQLTGEVAYGTPGFVAPEAIRDSTKATACSDIYAVGAIAYVLLTARPIFVEANVVKLLLRQLKDDPTPPSAVTSQAIPADLEDLVLRMIQRKPELRPQSMDEVIAGLNACVDSHGWSADDARIWWSAYPQYFSSLQEQTLDADQPPTISVQMSSRKS